MEGFKLQPVDVCVDVNEDKDPYHVLERWALGNPYTHVRIYFGQLTFLGRPSGPLFYESRSRGVILTGCRQFIGQKMVVMRLKPQYNFYLDSIREQMFEIATDEQSFYDYLCIPTMALPRLLCEKLGIPLPLKYQRNPWMNCSEAGAEPFWQVNLEVLDSGVLPLPGDFVTSPLLDKVNVGELDLSWLPEV
jgi:hypothetical protein